MTTHHRLLVIGEMFEGKPRPVVRELVTAARQVADALSAKVILAVLGAEVESQIPAFQVIGGVDEIVTVANPVLAPYLPGPWVDAVSHLVKVEEATVVLIPSSITGRDYAARVAVRCDAAMIPDATSLTIVDGQVAANRSVLGSRFVTTVTHTGSGPVIITIAPGAFPRVGDSPSPAPVRAVPVEIDADRYPVQLVASVAHTAGAKGLTEAERIVAGGRGLGKPEHFALVEELAAVLHAAVGASGATVGAGWRSHDDQVGSTGHTVSPRLYFAVGISGAPQHLVGMAGSEYVVAINRDPQAPIFGVASFGIVGDLFEVVPALIDELRKPET